ncbi:response regulator [Actinoplanes couchii]|uniref:DNA-binding response regulator n=1 Tax=Actinoplanes couchii TaxID=403638 RepID=A0ABQ3WZK9_9ACTN|nr:response regulator transcription factor [Actinoplanes couchii]MDR6316099.1 DNA-binding NarL/FixJ family response regulator [Actinoplanes couchii]GID51714.1 DNA-binding response regulator [Actinoplanes couchii]
MTISVAVVDDEALIRGSLRILVETVPDMRVVGEAADGAAAVDLVTAERPDVVLMDVRMPGLNGVEATRRITTAAPLRDVKVIILTTFDLDEYVYAALRAGASGFLLKDTAPAALLDAIRLVAAGEALLAPTVTRRLLREFAARPGALGRPPRELSDLTRREREVLTLVARGLSNTELAEHLVLSPATIKTYVTRLLAKLGARDRATLVMIAYDAHLVEPRSATHRLGG